MSKGRSTCNYVEVKRGGDEGSEANMNSCLGALFNLFNTVDGREVLGPDEWVWRRWSEEIYQRGEQIELEGVMKVRKAPFMRWEVVMKEGAEKVVLCSTCRLGSMNVIFVTNLGHV